MSRAGQNNFFAQAAQLSGEQYAAFKSAIETGKWLDGGAVSDRQRELMLQAIIIYERANPAIGPQTGVLDDRCASRSASPESRREEQAGASRDGLGGSVNDLLIASVREH